MQPNQAPGNDYDFILSGGQQSRPYQNPGDKKKRILMVVAGGALLLMVFAIVFSLIFGGGGTATERLVSLARQQTELMRVADIGVEKARGSDAQNLAAIVKLSVGSNQQELIPLIDRKLPAKELALGENAKTDELLTTAEQNNRFDEAFTELMTQELADYQAALKQAFDASSSASTKKVLNTAYQNTQTILGEAPNPQGE